MLLVPSPLTSAGFENWFASERLGADPLGMLIEFVTHPGNIVYAAAATQAAGMLFRSQILLRSLLLVGSGLYLIYYALAAEDPLWQAMAATTTLALANAYGLSMLLLSRSTRIIPADQLPLYEMLSGLEPGDFKALMRFGTARTLVNDETLTVKGEVPDRLFYIIDGAVEIEKDTAIRFRIASRHFIGEVSLVLGTPASATVWAPAGTRVIEWRRGDLAKAMDRQNRLKLAVEALIARDMARKVAVGAAILDTPLATGTLDSSQAVSTSASYPITSEAAPASPAAATT